MQMHHLLPFGICDGAVGIFLLAIRLSGESAFCFQNVCRLPNKCPAD